MRTLAGLAALLAPDFGSLAGCKRRCGQPLPAGTRARCAASNALPRELLHTLSAMHAPLSGTVRLPADRCSHGRLAKRQRNQASSRKNVNKAAPRVEDGLLGQVRCLVDVLSRGLATPLVVSVAPSRTIISRRARGRMCLPSARSGARSDASGQRPGRRMCRVPTLRRLAGCPVSCEP